MKIYKSGHKGYVTLTPLIGGAYTDKERYIIFHFLWFGFVINFRTLQRTEVEPKYKVK